MLRTPLLLGLASLGFACSSSPGSSNASPSTADSGSTDGSMAGDGHTAGDGSVQDAGPQDAAAGCDAYYLGMCVEDCGPYKTGFPNCDMCISISSEACGAAIACGTPDDGGVNDAGMTRCEQLLKCVQDCVAAGADAGVTTALCENMCKPAYNLTEFENYQELVSFIATFCPYDCPVTTQ
jgi:hypothetical protein